MQISFSCFLKYTYRFLITGITITMNDKQTFSMCLKQGVAAHGALIAEIGELASKEYVIEQSLDKMQAEWATKVMEITPYKNTGEFSEDSTTRSDIMEKNITFNL